MSINYYCQFMKLLLCCFLFCFSLVVKAQYHDQLMFGFKGGAAVSRLANVTNMLLRDDNRPLYLIEETNLLSPVVTLFCNYRFKDSQVGFEGQIGYDCYASDIEKHTITLTDSDYYRLKYQFLTVGLFPKVYLYRGFCVGAGASVGFCLNNSSGISYDSNSGNIMQNMQAQEHIRQSLKGRSNLIAGVCAAYEFQFGLVLEAGYFHGLTDVVETNVNPYDFTESRNNSTKYQLIIGWAIGRAGFYQK